MSRADRRLTSLHRYDWSESSLILDLFTREQGRIAVAAKGAKRPFSQLRSVLLPFQRLAISLGRQPPGDETREVHTLRAADWAGGHPMLTGAALFSGFYLNELLMKLLARHDPHAALFDAYAATVLALADADEARTPGGAARVRARAAEGDRPPARPRHRDGVAARRCVAERRYLVLADAGVVEADAERDATTSGATLVALQAALAADDLRRAATRRRRRAGRAAAVAARAASLSSRHFAAAHPPGHDRSAGAGTMNPLVSTGNDDRRGTTALSVNVNKIALLRNQRDAGDPERRRASRAIALEAGAHGITVHPASRRAPHPRPRRPRPRGAAEGLAAGRVQHRGQSVPQPDAARARAAAAAVHLRARQRRAGHVRPRLGPGRERASDWRR